MIPIKVLRSLRAYARAIEHAEAARIEATEQISAWAKEASQKEVAANLGCKPPYINDVVHGKRRLSGVRVARVVSGGN